MNYKETLDRMTEVVKECQEGFDTLGIVTRLEYDYMDRVMKSIESPERAKYLTVTLVLTTDNTPEGEEYCLSLGAEVKNGKVDEDALDRDIENFRTLVSNTKRRVGDYDSSEAAIREMANEASDEFKQLVEKIKEDEKKQKLTSIIGIVCVIAIFVIVTVFSIFSGSAG